MTEEQILGVLEAKKRIHPELRRPMTWNGLRRILAREDVALIITEMAKREAQLVQFDGAWAILLDSNASSRRYTYFGIHELGHLWLHHDSAADRSDRIYNMLDGPSRDTREDDAELFAVYALGGKLFQRIF